MIVAVQHIPNFVEGVDPKRAEVATQAELLAVPWIAQWATPMEHGAVHGPDAFRIPRPEPWPFSQWSLSRHGLRQTILMAEHDAGRHWWVVAYLSGDLDQLTLPEWKPNRSSKGV